MLYHFIEERNFADKAEFNIKWNNALPNGGWLSKDATLESETLRYERKWNYFMVLMAVLTFTCPLVILILGKIVLRINLFELDDTLQQNFAQGMKLTTGKEMTIAKAFDIAWKIAILSFLWGVWWKLDDISLRLYSLHEELRILDK
tara:strand:- start:941 stop:1378 length:438 start_codon:yes stop_codon:yes gene_type:complete